jgi:hypothetical protein
MSQTDVRMPRTQLLHNAGVARETPLEQIELGQWLRTLPMSSVPRGS